MPRKREAPGPGLTLDEVRRRASGAPKEVTMLIEFTIDMDELLSVDLATEVFEQLNGYGSARILDVEVKPKPKAPR